MSEVRLIDANRMKEHVAFQKDILANMGKDMEEIGNLLVNMINEEIDLQPTVDAVPVVRCKDCKHRGFFRAMSCSNTGEMIVDFPENSRCPFVCGRLCMPDDFFCPKGER